jgi:uncharacterized membrane protein
MLSFVYDILSRLGYPHPIHPSEVHDTIGLVVGAVIFRLAAVANRRRAAVWRVVAHWDFILALILLAPTVAAGVMDWQHYYSGAEIPAIRFKIGLTAVLVAVMAAGIFISVRKGLESSLVLPLYGTALLIVVAIGYLGGNLVYGDGVSKIPRTASAGSIIYRANCAGCHPNGGNVVDATAPILDSPKLASVNAFIEFIREPRNRDGSPGPMPPFTPESISDADATALFEYITGELDRKGFSGPSPTER